MKFGSRDLSKTEDYRSRLEKAQGYGKVWEIVKDTVKSSLGEYRAGMMLFLDDLHLQLGAYHPLGTNNIVLNRALVHMIETETESKRLVNSFVYVLLVHEYLHALGHVSEAEVKSLVYSVSRESFGEDHTATELARMGPWSLLKNIPLAVIDMPKRVMEIVKDFEENNKKYIA